MISRRPRTAGTCRAALVAIRRTRSADPGATRTATSGGRQKTANGPPTEHSGTVTTVRGGPLTDLRLASATTWDLPARAPVVSTSPPRTAATRRCLMRGGLSWRCRSCRCRSCPGLSCPGLSQRCRSCRGLSQRCRNCRALSPPALSWPRQSRRCLPCRRLRCGGLSSRGLSFRCRSCRGLSQRCRSCRGLSQRCRDCRGRSCPGLIWRGLIWRALSSSSRSLRRRGQVTARVSLLACSTTRRAGSTGRRLAMSSAASAPWGRERTQCRLRSRRQTVRPPDSDGRLRGSLSSFPVRMLRRVTRRTWRPAPTTTQ